MLHIPKPANYKRKSQGNDKKNKTLPLLVPISKPAIFTSNQLLWWNSGYEIRSNLVSCISATLNPMTHSTRRVLFVSLLYEDVVNNYEKYQNSTS